MPRTNDASENNMLGKWSTERCSEEYGARAERYESEESEGVQEAGEVRGGWP